VTRFLSVFRGPTALTPANASDVREGVADLAGSIMWLKTTLFDTFAGAEQIILGRSGNQLEVTGHSLPSNTAVRIFATSGGSIPGGLSANTVYYVRVIDADHIELSASSGPGAAVTITADGSGDQWIQTVPDWISTTLVSNATYGAGLFKNLVMWLAGTQTVTGAKTFSGQPTLAGVLKLNLAARSLTRLAGQNVINGVLGTTLPTTIDVTDTAVIPIEPPHGALITEVAVRIDPAVHASLPGVLPKIGLYRKTITEIDAVIEEETDAPVDAAAYGAVHNITLTLASPHAVDRSTYNYFIYFTPESGADSVAIPLRGAWYTFSTSAYDDGAG
jgi:hypothetical protein